MEPNKISVVIVSFHRAQQLRESLALLSPQSGPEDAPLQIIVVENGSQAIPASVDEEFPNVRFNRLPRNFGLTRALNIGIRSADGDYVLLLHDDVRITREAVIQLADFLESHADAGAVCPRFDGPQVRALPTPSNPDPPFSPASAGDEVAVPCVSGAAIMVRASFLRNMGHIDEHYGNYGSDIEICARIQSSNRKVIILGSAPAKHETSASPMPKKYLDGDHAAGTAAFLGKHHGFAAGLVYKLKTSLKALITFRFGVLSAKKIDGWG